MYSESIWLLTSGSHSTTSIMKWLNVIYSSWTFFKDESTEKTVLVLVGNL